MYKKLYAQPLEENDGPRENKKWSNEYRYARKENKHKCDSVFSRFNSAVLNNLVLLYSFDFRITQPVQYIIRS